MVPRENLEESVVRTGRDFPAGGNPSVSMPYISCKINRLGKLQRFLTVDMRVSLSDNYRRRNYHETNYQTKKYLLFFWALR